MRVDVYHNVLWSRYKGAVFSALYRMAVNKGDDYRFFQMAETEKSRIGLGSVDLSYHQYPFTLHYRGSVDELRWYRLVPRYFMDALSNRADFVLIAGYSEVQNWAQLIGLILRGTPRGVFCDSTLNDRPPNALKSLAKRFFFRRCDIVFCYGARARELVLKHGGNPESAVVRCQAAALPGGYDASAIPRRRLARASPVPRLLYVGRLAPEKNLERLIEAFAHYRTERPDATLRLVGSGPLRDRLAAHAERCGIADAVIFTGSMGEVALAEEYLAASCFVLPSLSEPWGLVVNEALAYGCPVVVSDTCGCIPELVDSAETGISFDPRSVDALVDALQRVERDFADIETVAQRCLARIADFTPDSAASQVFAAITHFGKRAAA